jgi:hypothetical protein
MFHAAVTLADPLPKRVFRIQRSDEPELTVIRHIGAIYEMQCFGQSGCSAVFGIINRLYYG